SVPILNPVPESRMMRLASAVVMLVVAATVPAASEKVVPKYKGKPLSYWLRKLEKAETDQEQRDAARVIVAFKADAAPDAKDAIPPLTTVLTDEKLRAAAVEALCRMGPAAKVALPNVRRAILKLHESKWTAAYSSPASLVYRLRAFGADAVPMLICFLDAGQDLMKAAIETLAEIGPGAKKSAPKLRRLLNHENEDIRFHTATALW